MFRFTIRDVLWLMVVVAMSVGWWLDRKYAPAPRELAGLRRGRLSLTLDCTAGSSAGSSGSLN
jgi:hypothetical protein